MAADLNQIRDIVNAVVDLLNGNGTVPDDFPKDPEIQTKVAKVVTDGTDFNSKATFDNVLKVDELVSIKTTFGLVVGTRVADKNTNTAVVNGLFAKPNGETETGKIEIT